MERVTAYVPSNYDEAMDSVSRLPPPPIWDIVRPRDSKAGGMQPLQDVESEFESVVSARSDLLCYENIFDADGKSAEERLEALNRMAPDTEKLVAAYTEALRNAEGRAGRMTREVHMKGKSISATSGKTFAWRFLPLFSSSRRLLPRPPAAERTRRIRPGRGNSTRSCPWRRASSRSRIIVSVFSENLAEITEMRGIPAKAPERAGLGHTA